MKFMRTATAFAALFCGLCVLRTTPSPGDICVPATVGLDPTQSNAFEGLLLGEGLGETFVADDTLIRSVVLWRIAGEDTNYVGMRLFIYETDSSSDYPSGVVPNPNRRVLNGQTVVVPFGDGVHPIEFKWNFDPPLALPHRGTYAFFVFQDPCGLAYLDVLTLYQRPGYPSGDAWVTGRSDCSGAIPSVGEYPDSDVIFQIEFCQDAVTQTRRSSWGRLKTTYR